MMPALVVTNDMQHRFVEKELDYFILQYYTSIKQKGIKLQAISFILALS